MGLIATDQSLAGRPNRVAGEDDSSVMIADLIMRPEGNWWCCGWGDLPSDACRATAGASAATSASHSSPSPKLVTVDRPSPAQLAEGGMKCEMYG